MTSDLGADRVALISTVPARRAEYRVAFLAALFSCLVFIIMVPFVHTRLPRVDAFIPAYQSALVVSDLVTAVLLLGQFGVLGSPALVVLAAGYLFTALMAAAHTLTFPGLFSPTGLLGAGPDSTAWIYMFWHSGFPLTVILYALLKGAHAGRAHTTGGVPGPVRRDIAIAILTVAAVAGALTALATAGRGALPVIMNGNQARPLIVYVAYPVWGFSFVALAVLWLRRPHSVLDMWLIVVMCAWIADVALSTVFNSARFTLGYYAGRLYGLAAANFVLAALLLEISALYTRLARSFKTVAATLDQRTVSLTDANLKLRAADLANQAKSEFLSRMSHELRTPLNAILGFAQLLEFDPLNTQQREGVGHILTAGRHLLQLINEVLDIARIEAGRLTVSREPILLHDVLRESVDLMLPLAAANNVQVTADPINVRGKYVRADAQRLKQVLLNFLSNAVKYGGRNGRVALSCDYVAGGRIRIKVGDTGPGIPPDKMNRLFTPFDRLGNEQSEIEGIGLGLALSKGLVEAMDGTVGVDSALGKGSTFWVELAAVESPIVQSQVDRDADLAPSVETGIVGTVLYVENNLANFALVQRILSMRPNVRLLAAMQGQLGLDLAREHRPDVILLDLHLPDISGEEVLHRLREAPDTRRSAVIVITADATPGQGRSLTSAGADAFLTKPIDVRKFLATLDGLLQQSEAHGKRIA